MIRLHDSHFLLLLDLLLLFLVVLHDLQPLSLDQAALLDVELLLGLQVVTGGVLFKIRQRSSSHLAVPHRLVTRHGLSRFR